MNLGIYIHFPFCQSRCTYCDFATGLYDAELASRYVRALAKEIREFALTEGKTPVDSIYFGGGTPSLMSPVELEILLAAIRHRFQVDDHAEVTMEMNPGSAGTPSGDKTNPEAVEVLKLFRQLGVNRVSFGAQTFADEELIKLGRSHSSRDITQTFQNLRAAGFQNVSLDLIAGLPGQTIDRWRANVTAALALRPEHLSFYLLEVHEGTPLASQITRGIQPRPDDDLAGQMYELMLAAAKDEGYEHYEISNLCLPGRASRHNTKYWTGQPYYGFGCSSHSFDGQRRRWANERDAIRYMELIEQGKTPIVSDSLLTESEARSEAVFLGLRLMKGLDTGQYYEHFRADLFQSHGEELRRFSEAGLIEICGQSIKLTRAGALLSNEVFAAFV